jgi:hypothetical protein
LSLVIQSTKPPNPTASARSTPVSAIAQNADFVFSHEKDEAAGSQDHRMERLRAAGYVTAGRAQSVALLADPFDRFLTM